MDTAIFGSVADLKSLLDKGLNPNSETKGGTTLLMLAQPDIEKTKLLLARGANLNARSKTRFSALMVAAKFLDSAPVMNLLLDKGAAIALPKGSGAPLLNMSPLWLAAQSRNAAIIPRLCKAGDNPNSKAMILGIFPNPPLLSAITTDGTAVTKALLDCGVKADTADDDDISALAWAAIGNDTAVAKLLIERGANVNHVDKRGMTPLLYAASIDFGDSSMVDLLLKSGANLNAKSKAGRTAAQLARDYGHKQVLRSLTPGNTGN